MSTAAVSSSSLYQELQAYFQQRSSDLQQLGQALQNGDLATAQQEFNAIQTLAQSGPFANGEAFRAGQRQQDFAALGQALQSGDLTGAQQAFAQLESTPQHQKIAEAEPPAVYQPSVQAEPSAAYQPSVQAEPPIVINLSVPPSTSSTVASNSDSQAATAAASTASSSGPEIVLNLGSASQGEQITIGLSNSGDGVEQVTIGVANQQNQNPEEITLNLSQYTNQEIILNLFNAADNSTQSSGVSVTA